MSTPKVPPFPGAWTIKAFINHQLILILEGKHLWNFWFFFSTSSIPDLYSWITLNKDTKRYYTSANQSRTIKKTKTKHWRAKWVTYSRGNVMFWWETSGPGILFKVDCYATFISIFLFLDFTKETLYLTISLDATHHLIQCLKLLRPIPLHFQATFFWLDTPNKQKVWTTHGRGLSPCFIMFSQ